MAPKKTVLIYLFHRDLRTTDQPGLQTIRKQHPGLKVLPIFIFIALIAPLVLVAYKLGFVFDKTGWLDTKS